MTRTARIASFVVVGVLGWGGWGLTRLRADERVDPAAKQLQATHGLFKRGLYKEAAEEYARFLKQHGGHSLATEARYGLAVALFRQNEFAKAAEPLAEVLKDAKFAQRDEALAVLGHCYLT